MKYNNLHYRSFRVSWYCVFQIRFVDWLISFRPLVPSSLRELFWSPSCIIYFFLYPMLHFLLILFDLFWCFWLAWFLSPLCAGHNVHGKSVATSSLPWLLFLLNPYSFRILLNPVSTLVLLFHLPASSTLFLISLLSFTSKMRLLIQIRFYPLLPLLGLLDVLCCLFVLALSFSWGGFKQIKIELFRTVSKELEETSCPARATLKIEGTKLSNTA